VSACSYFTSCVSRKKIGISRAEPRRAEPWIRLKLLRAAIVAADRARLRVEPKRRASSFRTTASRLVPSTAITTTGDERDELDQRAVEPAALCGSGVEGLGLLLAHLDIKLEPMKRRPLSRTLDSARSGGAARRRA